MDLRALAKPSHVTRAQDLVVRGLMAYQPFIFADDLQTGVGYEFVTGHERAGLVYWPTIPPRWAGAKGLERFILNPALREPFIAGNAQLRATYDHFAAAIDHRLGGMKGRSFLDCGCNAGYFPVAMSRLGAARSVGIDRENYTPCFDLLNELLGTAAQFEHRAYEHRPPAPDQVRSFDVVMSSMVLCHLSDPLQYLHWLGEMAGRAVFLWLLVTDDADLCLRFGPPNKYYTADPFPYCFDNFVRPSVPLVRCCLERMGFPDITELDNGPGGLPTVFMDVPNRAFLALRA